jgi:hypothetical protein
MRVAAATLFVLLAASLSAAAGEAQTDATSCVAIGKPDPAKRYQYRFTDSRGTRSDYSNQWDEITATGSRLRTTKQGTGGTSQSTYVSEYRIERDVTMVTAYRSSGNEGGKRFGNTTRFTPAVLGDPALRACANRTWTIAVSTATHQSSQGTFTAKTDPGQLRMLSLRESVTVPAGTFDTVRYVRTTTSAAGQVRDEYWKSIEHGVIVRHHSSLPGATSSEVLQAIR